MPGAGATDPLFRVEDAYRDGGSGTWYQPGVNIDVQEVDLDRALQAITQPNEPGDAGHYSGQIEGAFSIEFAMTDEQWHDLVFMDGGTALQSDLTSPATSAEWFLPYDRIGGTDFRALRGVGVVSGDVSHQEGNEIRVSLTCIYATEADTATFAPPDEANIERPTEDQIYQWSETTLEINGLEQELPQSATLSISELVRSRRGGSKFIEQMVVGDYSVALDTNVTYTEDDQRNLAYGGAAGATEPIENVDAVPATFEVGNAAGDTTTYNFSGLKHGSYSWEALAARDEDLSESSPYQATDVEVV